MRYEVARKLCEKLSINQRWLATGRPPIRPNFSIGSIQETLIPGDLLFSHAFDAVLDDLLEFEIEIAAYSEADYGEIFHSEHEFPLSEGVNIIAKVVQQALARKCSKMGSKELRTTLVAIERQIGPFTKHAWRMINHALKAIDERSKADGDRPSREVILKKLGITERKPRGK